MRVSWRSCRFGERTGGASRIRQVRGVFVFASPRGGQFFNGAAVTSLPGRHVSTVAGTGAPRTLPGSGNVAPFGGVSARDAVYVGMRVLANTGCCGCCASLGNETCICGACVKNARVRLVLESRSPPMQLVLLRLRATRTSAGRSKNGFILINSHRVPQPDVM